MVVELKNLPQAQMYEGAPWCLGRYDSFEVNQPQLITLLGYDYVIWKDKAGNLNALDNLCPHAGASLARGGYIVDFEGKNCLACPYHGNKIQFLGNGQVVIDNNLSNQAIQQVLPLQVVDGLVWSYGLHWQKREGKLTAKPVKPKLPIPDYSYVPYLRQCSSQIQLDKLKHIYSRSESLDCNLLQAIWNIHDAEHFAGTHRQTMLAKEVKIDNLTQNENKLSWQLITYKQNNCEAKRNKMNLLIDPVMVQSFNTFLPSFAVVPLNYYGKLIISTIFVYPESPQKTRNCLDVYTDCEFSWWQKLLKLSQLANMLRDSLVFEDMFILNNLYTTFEKKINLKNDMPAELAMNYLKDWNNCSSF